MRRHPAHITPHEHVRDLLLQPTFIMCPPSNLQLKGDVKVNDFATQQVDRDLAMEQWSGFASKLTELGSRIITIVPDDDNYGQVYTADPQAFHTDIVFSDDRKSITGIHHKSFTSKFTNPKRHGEVESHLKASFNFSAELEVANNIGIDAKASQILSTYNTEGSGDNIFDPYRGMWWSGYSTAPNNPRKGRSDIRSHAQLEAFTNRPVLSMEVSRPYFHIDTSHTPLPRGHVISLLSGTTLKSIDTMREKALRSFGLPEDKYLIEVTQHDAEQFMPNLTPVTDKDLIVPDDGSDGIMNRLEQEGYRLHPLPYTEMRKLGGLFHCTANRVNILGPQGGIANDPDFYDRIEAALSPNM